jgi:hypothetical protein
MQVSTPPEGAMTDPASAAPVVYAESYPQQRRGLFSGLRNRLGNLFHRDSDSEVQVMPGEGAPYVNGTVTSVASPMSLAPMPMGAATTAVPLVTTAEPPQAQPVVPVAAQTFDATVEKRFQEKVGHGEDYSWITGQLLYVHVDGGLWVIRYASVGEEDKYGGSAVLAPAVNMKNYREGDLVSVSGEVLDQGRASPHLGGCLYRASTIDLIERAD